MTLKEILTQKVEEIISDDPSLFLVALSFNEKSKRPKLEILIDGDQGITIDQCASISRQLSSYLEENPEVIDKAFILEVSSPGTDRPLEYLRQYRKNVGRTIKFTFIDHDVMIARLDQVTDTHLTVAREKRHKYKISYAEPQEIALADIMKAVVQVSFAQNKKENKK